MDNNQTITIGDRVKEAGKSVAAAFAYTIGVFVYLAAIAYAEAHAFSMLSAGVNPDFMIWAAAGMIAVGATAIALPILIFMIIKGTLEWWVALAFYAVDLGLMMISAAVDFQINSSGALPSWGQAYVTWVLPMTPVLVAAGWIIKTLVSPSIQKRLKLAQVEAALEDIRINQMIKHASSTDAAGMIDAQAAQDAGSFIAHHLGNALYTLPKSRVIDAAPVRALPDDSKYTQVFTGPPAPARQYEYATAANIGTPEAPKAADTGTQARPAANIGIGQFGKGYKPEPCDVCHKEPGTILVDNLTTCRQCAAELLAVGAPAPAQPVANPTPQAKP